MINNYEKIASNWILPITAQPYPIRQAEKELSIIGYGGEIGREGFFIDRLDAIFKEDDFETSVRRIKNV